MTAPKMDFPRPNGAAPVVSFPRSENRTDPTYGWQYRLDCKESMRVWVADRLKAFDSTSQLAARQEAERKAVKEIDRPLHMPERLLLATAVRDYLFAKNTLRRNGVLR